MRQFQSEKNPKYNQKFVDSLIFLINQNKLSGRLKNNLLRNLNN